MSVIIPPPVYVGDREPIPMSVFTIQYCNDNSTIRENVSVQELAFPPNGILWINVTGLNDVLQLQELCDKFKIHILTLEDILNTEQHPKMEQFDDYLYFSVKSIERGKNENSEPIFDQISMIVTENLVITFQEIPGDTFDIIRKRIFDNAGHIRNSGADYLTYCLIDSIVDEYILVLEQIEDSAEELEQRAMITKYKGFIAEIQERKRILLQMRRAIAPLRDSLNTLQREGTIFQQGTLKPYLQDLREHVTETLDSIDSCRELLMGITEVNLSTMSNEMNQVMKALTILSAIFIPLTFIAGVYGMNFTFMPELQIPWAYPLVWGIMLAVAVGMLIFFKCKKWL